MNLLKTLGTISGMTLLSRITGLIRDSLFASVFGVSAMTDAFNVAFRIPNLLRRLFAEGAFSQAFVPMLAEYKTQKTPEQTKLLADHVATVLVWATLLTALLGIAGAPLLIYGIATGLTQQPTAFDGAVLMTRIMFPYICCMSFVALAGGILNTWREFKIPAFSPVLLNLSFIICSLFVAPHLQQPIYAMAWAVMAGGLLQVAIQIPALRRVGMLPRLSLRPLAALQDEAVRRILLRMGPAIFAVSATQLSIMINTSIASRLGEGSISALFYADRLMEFPTALLGVALGTILLPGLSAASSKGDTETYHDLLDWGLRLSFLLALPAAIGLGVLAVPLISTLFHYGKFDAHAVEMARQPLIAYGVGLIGFILVKILAPAFYAKQNIKTPVKIAIGVMLATQAMNVIFVPLFSTAGLALSVGLGACGNALFLYIYLRRAKVYAPRPGWTGFYLKLILALLVMAAVAACGAHYVPWIALGKQPFLRAGLLMGVILACMLVYFATLFALGFRIKDFKRRA